MRRFRTIPPLQYLLGFEAAARLGSFAAAADELGLTHSAVSHQLRALEERLGQPLFLRVGRHVRLTDAGRDYRHTVAESLEGLEKGQMRLAPYANPASVVIYAPRDFAARWLMPRLGDLLAGCPGAEPWLDTSGLRVDFAVTEASIAIDPGAMETRGELTLALGSGTLAALARPDVARRAQAGDPVDILHAEAAANRDEWPDAWRTFALARTLTFSDADLALTAAEGGIGVAIAPSLLARSAVDAGRLAPIGTERLAPGRAWLARTTESEMERTATAAVWAWLRGEAVA